MTDSTHQESSDIETGARQLALVDRIIGLEAELANLRVGEPHRLRNDIEALKSSATWRAGRIVLAPARTVRRLIRLVTKK